MAKKRKEITIIFDENTIWTTGDKALFRKTKPWIEFRNRIIKTRKKCELCGYNKRMHLHHIYLNDKAADYANLDETRFKTLCSGCHKFLHRCYGSYIRKKDPVQPDPRFEVLLNEFVKI